MNNDAEGALDARYRKHFGYLAGYLPKDRSVVDEWHRELKREIGEAKARGESQGHSPAVAALADLIERDGIVRMYVTQMLDQQPPGHDTIKTVEELLAALDKIVKTAPEYNPDPSKHRFFPMSTLFAYMMMTPAGEAVFRNDAFNGAIRGVLQEWCRFLDSEASLYVLNTRENGWLSQSAYWYNKLYDFVIPDQSAQHWGWRSYNDYFHRDIQREKRPVAAPDDPKVVVSANDGKVYNIASNVQRTDTFWLKAQPYSLVNMLNNDSEYVERFVGGSVFQSFLSGADFHRWCAPVAGVVRRAYVVDGLMFSDAESAGFDPDAGPYSQGYEASVNTRGLVFIESHDPNIGTVCVVPIGITEISSVTIHAKPGQEVRKGEEIGYFSYGGSSMCLVFQPGAVDRFTVPNRPAGTNAEDGPPIRVNAQIAVAR